MDTRILLGSCLQKTVPRPAQGLVPGTQLHRGSGRRDSTWHTQLLSKIPVYSGLCLVSPRNTFWKCCVFRMCVISGGKILLYQHDSTEHKPYVYKVASHLPWKETNLPLQSTWHEVFWTRPTLVLLIIYCTQRFYEMLYQHHIINPHPVR